MRNAAVVIFVLLVAACYQVQRGHVMVFLVEPGKYVPVFHFKMQATNS